MSRSYSSSPPYASISVFWDCYSINSWTIVNIKPVSLEFGHPLSCLYKEPLQRRLERGKRLSFLQSAQQEILISRQFLSLFLVRSHTHTHTHTHDFISEKWSSAVITED
jgi:hypothetical protein